MINIEWPSDQECRDIEIELSDKQTRDQFFEYHANSKEEYVRMKKEYERTGVITEKIIVFETKMANKVPPRHFIFEVDMEYPNAIRERDDDYPMASELMTITPETIGPKQHELRAKYFAAACQCSRKLICSFLP